ncbi:ERF family protein [Sphingomonas sp. MMS24-JH45]
MTTQLSHESGEWMRGTLIPLSKVDAQGYGSAVTYARRYALAAVVGVCRRMTTATPPAAPSIAASSSRLTASATTSATF